MQHEIDVVIDLETVTFEVTEQDITEYMESWKPPGSISKPETIEKYRLEAFANAKELIQKDRRFHIGGAFVVSAGLGTVEHGEVKNVEVFTELELESSIAGSVCDYLDSVGSYRLVGFNIKDFDMLHLRRIFHLYKRRPRYIPSRWGVVDMMDLFRGKSGHSCKAVAKAFGITPRVPYINGSHVQALYEAGDAATIKAYNESDIYLEGELFVALSSAQTL